MRPAAGADGLVGLVPCLDCAARNETLLLPIGESLTEGLKIDDHMTLVDGLRFAWNMGRLDPESVVLPTTPTTTSGGAAVLLLQQDAAEPSLATFRD